MQSYISTKLVKAKPMTRGKYNKYRGWTIPANENPSDEGYLIEYKDGYISWCPKEQFEKYNLKVDDNKNLPSGVSIGSKMVKDFIKSYEVIERHGKTTIVHATLINGYKLTEASSCVDPKNYNKEIGVKCCLEKIENQIWALLGFLLQSSYEGFK
ncbi:Gp49 family protein [Clostridium sp.]|uniref:Gp49 family protein n=1 Tax=Clostridium sp. TaxID=1506 RepID=UPI00261DFE80